MQKVLNGILTLSILLVTTIVNAQVDNPVQWKISSQKIDDRTFEIRASAIINYPYHIYSQEVNEDLGLPTKITLNKNPLVEVVGTPKEIGKPEEAKIEGVAMKYYPGKVEFVQVVKLKEGIKAKTNISGAIEYMACTNINCLPPATRRFNVSLDGGGAQ